MAVAQPVLDLFGNNAEFFVAGSYSTAQIVAFALFVVSVVPLIGIGLTTLGYLVDRRVGTAVFAAVVALLADVDWNASRRMSSPLISPLTYLRTRFGCSS